MSPKGRFILKLNFLKMPLKSTFTTLDYSIWGWKKKKEMTIQQEKIVVGTLPESPLQDL